MISEQNKWINVNKWMTKWMDEQTNKQIMNKERNELMSATMNERINEKWMKWINRKWMKIECNELMEFLLFVTNGINFYLYLGDFLWSFHCIVFIFSYLHILHICTFAYYFCWEFIEIGLPREISKEIWQ